MGEKKRFVPITRKINTIIVLGLIIGIGSITFYFARSLFSTIDMSTESNFNQQTDMLYTAIENFMLAGEAPIAVSFFEDLQERSEDFTISLYRRSGIEAFSDNSTIREVNENLDMRMFDLRGKDDEDPMTRGGEMFEAALGPPPMTEFFRTEEGEKSFFRAYEPLLNLPKCTGCHGSDHTVRGVIDIASDVTRWVKKQRQTIYISGGLFSGMVVLLAIALTGYLRNSIIRPVKQIGSVCEGVTKGDFDSRVSIRNRDEIGRLGSTVNTMVEGLHERFMLSKYVSNSTLESLRADKHGEKVPVTLFFSDIRGFTSYSDEHLPEEVVNYLNTILNMQTEIISDYGGDVDKYVGDEIVALFAKDNPELTACRAAVKIREELRNKSEAEYGGLEVGFGINAGEVILGMIGSDQRADYTVIGDNVNIASRLCDVAKPLQIVISNAVYEKVAPNVEVDGPYKLKVKGKKQFIKVYTLLSMKEENEELSV
jgi:adenylate cyclase